MFLTIEELYAFKEQYVDELNKAQAKVVVICDLIKLAQDKEPIKTECEEYNETETQIEEKETVEVIVGIS